MDAEAYSLSGEDRGEGMRFTPLYLNIEHNEILGVMDEVVLDYIVHPGLDIEEHRTTPPWIITAIDEYKYCQGIGKDGMHRGGEMNMLRKIRHWDSIDAFLESKEVNT